MKKRMIALLLCLCMTLTLLPVQAFAEEEGAEGQTTQGPLSIISLYTVSISDQDYPLALHVNGLDEKAGKEFNFTFPAQQGIEGDLSIGTTGNIGQDLTIQVKQGDTELRGEESNRYMSFQGVSLDAGKDIKITAVKGGITYTYTIKIQSMEVPSLKENSIEITGYNLIPAFEEGRRDYALRVPANAGSIKLKVNDVTDDRMIVVESVYHVNTIVYHQSWSNSTEAGKEKDLLLTDSDGKQVTELQAIVTENNISQTYRFMILRSDPGTAELTDDYFGLKGEDISYDGKAHPVDDFLDISSLLDRNKLRITLDDARTSEIEKLTSVTDAGDYYVYVSYDGDDVYAKVEDKQLFSGAYPLRVCLHQAQLTVENSLSGNTLELPYSMYYIGEDQKGIEIKGLTVKYSNGQAVPGKWKVYTKDQPQTELTCKARAEFAFADESMEKNYYVNGVDLTLNTRKITLSGKDIEIYGNKWDEERNYTYPYSPNFGRVPSVQIWQLAGNIPRHGTYGSTSGVKEYEFYKEEYDILDENGNPVEGVKKNEEGFITSGPTAVGKYKLRISIPKSSLHKILNPFVEFEGNAEEIYKDIPYTIAPAEICPNAELRVNTSSDGTTYIYSNITCSDLMENPKNVFNTVFKVGDQVIEPNAYGDYSYDLPAGDTSLVTFTVALKKEQKGNYTLSADSVLTATFNPNGTPLTPVASPGAKVVHDYDGSRYCMSDKFNGKIEFQGLPEGKQVSCTIRDITLSSAEPGERTATVRLELTGAAAEEYVLTSNSITVPATINSLNLGDPRVRVNLTPYEYIYYATSDSTYPREPRVEVFAPSGHELPDSCYKVTYLNNTLPSVRDQDEYGADAGIMAKAVITGVEGGPVYGSATGKFLISMSGGARENELYTMEKGDKKELLIETRAALELQWDDHGAIDVKAGPVENGQSKVTIEALRAGEAILLVKGANYSDYYLYGFTVTDENAPVESIPSTVFAGTVSDPVGAIRANRITVRAEAGTGKEESGLGVVRPVTVSGQTYPIDKDGYKFILNAVPGYDQATGYKLAIGTAASELELTGGIKELDKNVTNGRAGMSHTFTAATPEALKALTGTLVRLQWYKDSTPLGQPETYRLNFDGLQAKSDIGIESIAVYSYDESYKYSVDNDITAKADDDTGKIILKGKAPSKIKEYNLRITTTLGGYVWVDIKIKPGTTITYEFVEKGWTGPVITDDKKGFYILNKRYTFDIDGVQELTYVAPPVTSGKVAASVTGMTEEQVNALKEVVSGSSSVGLTAALVADEKIDMTAPAVTDENKTKLQEAMGDSYNDGAVKSVIQPYLDVTVTGYGDKYGTKTIEVNIDAMCRTVVTTATNIDKDNAIKVDGETAGGETANAIVVGDSKKVTVNTPVKISLKLPGDFIGTGNNRLTYAYVKHMKGSNAYYYFVSIDRDGVATFTSTHGLSPFELRAGFQPEAGVQAPNAPDGTAPTYFETLKEAVEAAEDGDIIEISKSITNASITANISADKQLRFKLAEGVTCDDLTINGAKIELSDGNEVVDTVIKKNSGGSGSSDIGGYTPTFKTYEVKTAATANGRVTVSPQNAAKDATVTITATPDEGYEIKSVTVTDAGGKAVAVAEENGKYSFKMPSGNVTVTAEFVPVKAVDPGPWKNPFPDVSNTAWYIDAVEYAAVEGLMEGYANGRFGPNDDISRAEFAQIIYNKERRPSAGDSVFSDVKADKWYSSAVTWVAAQKIVTGVGDNKFAPDRPITREELATMLWRYAGGPKPVNTTLDFKDAGKISNFAKEAMLWANENGIVNGKGNGLLDPKGKATRAEAAQMLMNYLKK